MEDGGGEERGLLEGTGGRWYEGKGSEGGRTLELKGGKGRGGEGRLL